MNKLSIVSNIRWAQGVLHGITVNCNEQVKERIKDVIDTLDYVGIDIQAYNGGENETK